MANSWMPLRPNTLADGAIPAVGREQQLEDRNPAEQVDAGLITPQQAAQSGQRNLVTRALGVENTVQVETNEFQVQPQDLYLMCSDGLSEMLGHADLSILTAADVPLDDKVQRLIDAANARGGRDNISVVLVQADSSAVPRKRGLVSRLLGSA